MNKLWQARYFIITGVFIGLSTLFFVYNLSVKAVSWDNAPIMVDSTVGLRTYNYAESSTLFHSFSTGNNDGANPTRYSTINNGVTSTPESIAVSGGFNILKARGVFVGSSGMPYALMSVITTGPVYGISYAYRVGGGIGTGCGASSDADWSCVSLVSASATAVDVVGANTSSTLGLAVKRYGADTNRNISYYSCDITSTANCDAASDWSSSIEQVVQYTDGTSYSEDSYLFDIAFNNSNQPVIVYIDGTNLRYAVRDGGAGGGCLDSDWSCYVIEANSTLKTAVSIAVDVDGKLGATYVVGSGNADTLRYAYQDGVATSTCASGTAGFSCETIVTSQGDYNAILHLSMVYNNTVPIVSWNLDNSSGSDYLKVTHKYSGATTTVTAATMSATPPRTTALSISGNVLGLSYFEESDDRLYFVTTTYAFNVAPSATTPYPVQTSADVVTVTTTITDTNSDVTSLAVQYSTDNSTWSNATLGAVTVDTGSVSTSSGSISSIDTNVDGTVSTTFEWRVSADITAEDSTVYLRIIPNDGTVSGATSTSAAFAVDTAAPSQPGDLVLGSAATSSAIINFGATSTDANFFEYKIYYSSTSPVTATSSIITSSTDADLGDSNFNGTTSTTISGLDNNATYYAKIIAIDDFARSTWSSGELSFTTLAPLPTGLATTSISATAIFLTADRFANDTIGTAGYQFSLFALDYSPVSSSAWISGSGLPLSFTGLSPSTGYIAEVKYRNSGSVETVTTSLSVSTNANPNDPPSVSYVTSPSQVSLGTVSFAVNVDDGNNNTTTLSVLFSTNTVDWVSSTILSATPDQGSVDVGAGIISSIDNDLSTRIVLNPVIWDIATDLPNTEDSTVYLRLTPNDGTEDGSPNTSAAFTVDNIAPTAPGNLTTSSIAINSATLSFGSASVDGYFDQYIIYRDTTSPVTTSGVAWSKTSDTNLDAINFNGATATVITGLTANTKYYFNILAHDPWQSTWAPAEIYFYTLAPVPSGLSVSGESSSGANYSISAFNGAGTGSSGYKFTTYLSSGYSYVSDSGWLTTNSYTVSGLSASTAYIVEGKYRNGDGVETVTTSASFSTGAEASPTDGGTVTSNDTCSSGLVWDTTANKCVSTELICAHPKKNVEGVCVDYCGDKIGEPCPPAIDCYGSTAPKFTSFISATGASVNLSTSTPAGPIPLLTNYFGTMNYQISACKEALVYVVQLSTDNFTSADKTAPWSYVRTADFPSTLTGSESSLFSMPANTLYDYALYNKLAVNTESFPETIYIRVAAVTKEYGVMPGESYPVKIALTNAVDFCTTNPNAEGCATLLTKDTDEDDYPDIKDNCPTVPNTNQTKTDPDSLYGDVCNPEMVDSDGDTYVDSEDNCMAVFNPDQKNSDIGTVGQDAFGDACDNDDDGDGFLDNVDKCPLVFSADNTDTDKDGVGDVCDTDDDNDGVSDEADWCPLVADPLNEDLDKDGLGDVCDPDKDGDGIINEDDNCPTTPNPKQEITAGNTDGDACARSCTIEDPTDCVCRDKFCQKEKECVGDECKKECEGAECEQAEDTQNIADVINNATGGSAPIGFASSVAESVVSAITNAVSTAVEAIKDFVAQAGETIIAVAKVLNEFADNPQVEKITQNVVVPLVVAAAATNVATGFGFIQLLGYLRNLFTQPLLLLRRRKKKDWGTVYNAFTKQPVDLALVRLYDAKTGKLVKTRVTDGSGRYLMSADPGQYRIEVVKAGFGGLSKALAGLDEDIKFVNLYHGEPLNVNEETTLAYSIPLDPSDDERSTAAILRDKSLKTTRMAVSLSGVGITAVSFAITPSPSVAAFFFFHLLCFAAIYRLAHKVAPVAVGMVTDTTGKPLSSVVVRVFDAAYNKLVESAITDAQGRYGILVGPSIYYVTYEKAGYVTKRSPDLDYSSVRTHGLGGVINRSEKLEPAGKGGGINQKPEVRQNVVKEEK